MCIIISGGKRGGLWVLLRYINRAILDTVVESDLDGTWLSQRGDDVWELSGLVRGRAAKYDTCDRWAEFQEPKADRR